MDQGNKLQTVGPPGSKQKGHKDKTTSTMDSQSQIAKTFTTHKSEPPNNWKPTSPMNIVQANNPR